MEAGSVIDTATYTDKGFEAYGTFEEGVNPEVPFGRTAPTYLIPINEDTDTFTILAPNNTAGKLPSITCFKWSSSNIIILSLIQV